MKPILLKAFPFLNLQNLIDFREKTFSLKTCFMVIGLLALLMCIQGIRLVQLGNTYHEKVNYGFTYNQNLNVSFLPLNEKPFENLNLTYPDKLIKVENIPVKNAEEYKNLIFKTLPPKPLKHTFQKANGEIFHFTLQPYYPDKNDFFIRFLLPWASSGLTFLAFIVLVFIVPSGRSLYLLTTSFFVNMWLAHIPEWESTHVFTNLTFNFGLLFCFLLILGPHIIYDLRNNKTTQNLIFVWFFIWLAIFLTHNYFLLFQKTEVPSIVIAFYALLFLVCLRGTVLPAIYYFYPKKRPDAWGWLPCILFLWVLALLVTAPLFSILFQYPLQLNYFFPLAIFFPFIPLYSSFVSNLSTANETLKKEVDSIRDLLIKRTRLNTAHVLLAGISHEILNPLHIIFMWRAIIEKYQNKLTNLNKQIKNQNIHDEIEKIDSKIHESSDRIYDAAERINNIINSLREASKGGIALNYYDLNEEINKAIGYLNIVASQKDITLNYHSSIKEKVQFDASKINQVLVNVLNNAIGASSPKSKIDIQSQKKGGYFEVRIKDSGSGIDPEIKEKVFDPFFTTKDPGQGMGIGLYICSLIMKLHRGFIEINSKKFKGTTVKLKFPASSPSQS